MKTLFIITGAAILLAIAFISRFFLRMGKPVNETISTSYYHHAWKQKIIYSPMGNWFELGYKEMDADAKNFTVLSHDYGKDKQRIFWRGEPQAVDYSSFEIDKYGIPKDAANVYSDFRYGKSLQIVVGADPKTFKPYKLNNETYGQLWYKDAQSIFLYNKKVDVDRNTFERINQSLAYDSLSLYAIIYDYNAASGGAEENTKLIKQTERPDGNAETINENYARIGNAIILSNWKNPFAYLQYEKIEKVSIINERNIVVNDQLVSDGKIMTEIDVPSLVIIDRDFMKDKHAVYYDTEKISEAEPASFNTITEFYSKDQRHVFYKTSKLVNANPTTFEVNYATGIGSDGKLSFKDGVLVK